ncbi:sensor histidine kinase [Ramlibacter sp. PS4R-6]|uniref:sensor histidine kinase n=1 Tax=Ramlibacter sp. PS4R-6 TaxID=3133438 RepID=UPI0030951AD2
MPRIDWEEKLRHFVQVLAFCLVIATVQYGFQPDRPYGPGVVYSLFIGTTIWAVIDLGRGFFPSSAETGWPKGFAGVALVAGGIAIGWFFGTRAADYLCRLYGFYSPGAAPVDPATELRNSILITLLAGGAGTFYFYTANRSRYLERQMAEVRKHADEARLKLLETQLEPHMLFNTLANLRALIAVDPSRAQNMLDHMIAYLRATLNASRATSHSLQAEFDRIQDYLELMAIRMGPRLKFTLDLPGALAQVKVPSLLLQPLVENAIQHGLEPKVGGGEIRIAARREGEQVVLEVCDTGTGLGGALPATSKGFGTNQVRERLATLYGARATMEFGDVDTGGCRVVIRYPLPE